MVFKKIFIIEDDPMIAMALEFLMEQNQYDVLVANNGEKALTDITEFQPDLVLLDVMMPVISGLEICKTLRSQTRFQDTKIVLLTAKGRDIDVQKGLEAGADAYVTKPFSNHQLLQIIRDLLA